MRSLVLYESQFGNTRHIAELIANRLGTFGDTRLMPATDCKPAALADVDLVVIGAPTQAHGVTPGMRRFLTELQPVHGIKAAAFDTRVKGPRFLWGSAAREMAIHLERKGFEMVVPPESFLVTLSKEPALYAGEEEHAAGWAAVLGAVYREPAAIGG